MNSRVIATLLADRLIKGILVSGFENDADAEKVLEGQRSAVEGSIRRMLEDVAQENRDSNAIANASIGRLMLEVPVYAVIKAGGTLRDLLDYYTGVLKALELAEEKMSKSPEFNAWDLGPSPTLVEIRKALGKPTGEKK